MRKTLALISAIVLLSPLVAHAQDGRAALENVAKAMGATALKSITYTGSGQTFLVGQSIVPGAPWPQLTLKSQTRAINYETASLRIEQVVVRATDMRGGGAFTIGDTRQVFLVSGDHAWRMAADGPSPQPRDLADQQLQLWTSPHGVIKAAIANNAAVQGRTITFAVPGRLKVKATVDGQDLIEKVEAVFSNPVLGDTPFEASYSEYRGLRRREVPDEDPPGHWRVPGARADRRRGAAQHCRGHRSAGSRSPGHQPLRAGDEPGGRRRRLVLSPAAATTAWPSR